MGVRYVKMCLFNTQAYSEWEDMCQGVGPMPIRPYAVRS